MRGHTENTHTTMEEAKSEAEHVFGGGDGMWPQWVFRRPNGTYYVVSDRRYHDAPDSDEAVAKIAGDFEWTDYSEARA